MCIAFLNTNRLRNHNFPARDDPEKVIASSGIRAFHSGLPLPLILPLQTFSIWGRVL